MKKPCVVCSSCGSRKQYDLILSSVFDHWKGYSKHRSMWLALTFFIDEATEDAAGPDLGVVADVDAIADRLVVRQLGIPERSVIAVQIAVREVADVLHQHGVVGFPHTIEEDDAPAIAAFSSGISGSFALTGECRIAGEDPDVAVALLHRERGHAELGKRLAEEFVRMAVTLPSQSYSQPWYWQTRLQPLTSPCESFS